MESIDAIYIILLTSSVIYFMHTDKFLPFAILLILLTILQTLLSNV